MMSDRDDCMPTLPLPSTAIDAGAGAGADAPTEAEEAAARLKEKTEQDALPYKWSQTIRDVSVSFAVDRNLRGKDFVVTFRAQRISVVRLRPEPREILLEGDLHSTIKTEECTWSLSDGELLIHLEKSNQIEWWKNVVTHHPPIDTTKIVPENSRLDDLEGETRAMVEKMMYDQRQKAAGLPTSEEKNKMDMFKRFKDMHPEMDFSNAKMSF